MLFDPCHLKDPTVSLMEVEDKPDVTYDDVGSSKKA